MKRCIMRGRFKAENDFYKHKSQPGGTNVKCIDCFNGRSGLSEEYIRYFPTEYRRMKNLEAREKAHLAIPVTISVWLRALGDFNFECAITGDKDITLDHFIPVSAGGSTTYGNIIPLSLKLNSSKKDKNPFEWAESCEFLDRIRFNAAALYLAAINQMEPAAYRQHVFNFFTEAVFKTSN